MLGKAVDSDVQLLHLNDLEYAQCPPTSVVVGREFRTHVAKEQDITIGLVPGAVDSLEPTVFSNMGDSLPSIKSYSERTVSVSVPSGSRYIEPTTSYLRFDFAMDMPQKALGSQDTFYVSMNETVADTSSKFKSSVAPSAKSLYTGLFRNARWIHSSKREIDYIEDSAAQSYLHTLKQSGDWIRSIGSAYSFGPYTPAIRKEPQQFPAWGEVSNTVTIVAGQNDKLNIKYQEPSFTTVTLSPGNYSITTMLNAINAAFSTLDPPYPEFFALGDRLRVQSNTGGAFPDTVVVRGDGLGSSNALATYLGFPPGEESVGSNFGILAPLVWMFPLTYPRSPRPFTTVCIPLSVLFPSWRKNKGQYLPAQLVGGSTFEFTLNPISECFFMVSPGQLLNESSCSEVNFTQWKYYIRNFRVVLDERELASSVNTLMWELSTTTGIPLQTDTHLVSYSSKVLVAPEDQIFIEAEDTLDQQIKNLSRVNQVLVTPMCKAKNVVLDAFLPHVRAPLMALGDLLQVRDYQFTNGDGHWPLKEPTFSESLMPSYSFIQWMGAGGCALSLNEWQYYINGFYMSLQRQKLNSESGIPIKCQRPLDLHYSFRWEAEKKEGEVDDGSLAVISETYGEYVLRWVVDYQRYVNVIGHVLETLE